MKTKKGRLREQMRKNHKNRVEQQVQQTNKAELQRA